MAKNTSMCMRVLLNKGIRQTNNDHPMSVPCADVRFAVHCVFLPQRHMIPLHALKGSDVLCELLETTDGRGDSDSGSGTFTDRVNPIAGLIPNPISRKHTSPSTTLMMLTTYMMMMTMMMIRH